MGTYMGIYLVFALISVILQVVLNLTLKNKTNKKNKIWNMLLGVSVATIIFDIVLCCVMNINAAGMGDRVGIIFAACPFSIVHIVLCVMTFTKKEKYTPEIIRYNKHFIITGLIVLILMGTIIAIPKIIESISESQKDYNKIYASELNFLTRKYGDQNFEVVGEGDQTAPADRMFGNPRVLYHYALILEPTSGARIRVYENMGKYEDNFIEQYYPELIEKYLKKYDVSISFYLIDSVGSEIPNDFGHIPTLDELSERMRKYDEATITKRDYYYTDKNSELSFLKELSHDLATCLVREFKIGKDTKFKFRFIGMIDVIDETCYDINIQDYTLTITDKEKNVLDSLDLATIE